MVADLEDLEVMSLVRKMSPLGMLSLVIYKKNIYIYIYIYESGGLWSVVFYIGKRWLLGGIPLLKQHILYYLSDCEASEFRQTSNKEHEWWQAGFMIKLRYDRKDWWSSLWDPIEYHMKSFEYPMEYPMDPIEYPMNSYGISYGILHGILRHIL
jgi:hypothetical protein